MTGRRTLVVHSGTWKTGSSAIQVYLARAEHAGVLARAGATYPKVGRSAGVAHGNLNAELRGGDSFRASLGSWSDLFAQMHAGEAATTIVSSENFSDLSADMLADLGRRCREAGVVVRWVHYLRDQPGFYNAFYVERLVAMRPEYADLVERPFEEFRDWSPIDLSVMRYSTYVERVRTALPEAELVLRPFSRAHLHGGDVVADFCHTLGIPYVAEHAGETNVGTGWRTTETARRLTPLLKEARLYERCRTAENPAATRMRWLALLRSALVRASNEVGWNDTTAIYLTPAFRARLVEEYREDNERVGAVAGFDFAGIVESEPVRPPNVGDYRDVDAEEALHVSSAVLMAVVNPPEEIVELLTSGDLPPPEVQTLLGRVRGRLGR